MDEIVDIYDSEKKRTNKQIVRHQPLSDGEYTLGVQAIIINSKKELLISKRSKYKKICPLMWECNGGQVSAGEDGDSAIIREIEEELGITLKNGILFRTIKKEHKFKDLYLFYQDIDLNDLKYVDNEVIDAKWVSIDEYLRMFNNKEIVETNDFYLDDYQECLDIIKNKLMSKEI